MTYPATSDATEIAAMIRRKDITALEAVDTAIARAEALQPQLNFLVTSMYERARERAQINNLSGPFAGVPYLLKDMFDYEGTVTRWGCRVTAFLPPAPAHCSQVKALEEAGLVIIGRSALSEFGYLPTTEPVAFGPTRNPWDVNMSPGGSSGGSAAAVAAGVVPMADAADGGGSIRIPASACGLFGLKPSRGRLIGEHELAAGVELTAEHCVSRSVRDSATLFAAMERADADAPLPPIGAVTGPSPRRLRVGYMPHGLSGRVPDTDVLTATDATAKLLEDLGHHVEPTKLPLDGAALSTDFFTVWQASALQPVSLVRGLLGQDPDETMFEPMTLAMAAVAAQFGPGQLDQAKANLRIAAAVYDTWFESYDVILSPVVLKPTVPIGFITGATPADELFERLVGFVDNTPLHNAVGAPAMSVPLHWTDAGLPVGSHFAARVGDEQTLFELAYELEAAQPWANRQPPVFAS